MSEITREQFATAVSATLESVHHLYREVHRLLVGLREGLAELPDALAFVGGATGRSSRDQGRLVLRNEYSLLFKESVDDHEEPEDEDDESDDIDDEGDSAQPTRRKRPPAVIAGSDVMLAVGIASYDPRQADSFEPHVAYAAMSGWSVGGRPAADAARLSVPRYMLKRIPKVIMEPGLAAGTRVQTSATVKSAEGVRRSADRRLGCSLPSGVETFRLYELDSTTALQRLVHSMKDMWRHAEQRA
jgi:hypothetical protein